MEMATRTATFILPDGSKVTREVKDNTMHLTSVQWFADNHGYPYRAECSTCGWHSRGYVSRAAARDMADDHLLNA
jgi:hypothetical protein